MVTLILRVVTVILPAWISFPFYPIMIDVIIEFKVFNISGYNRVSVILNV